MTAGRPRSGSVPADATWRRPPERVATPRLVLRRWTTNDAPRLRAAIDASLAELKPWIPWAAHEPTTPAQLAERLGRQVSQFATGPEFAFAIMDPAETELLGGIGLFARIGPGALEVGYWLRSDAAGRGLATEATTALTAVALAMGAARVEIHCDPANVASTRVAAKAGYAHALTRPKDFSIGGGPLRDTMVWVYPPDTRIP